MHTTPEQLLKEARRFIVRGWSQGSFARDSEGKIVNRTDKAACRWCVLGALLTAADGLPGGHHAYKDAVARLTLAIGVPSGVVIWQDQETTTQADVLAAFDRAIAG